VIAAADDRRPDSVILDVDATAKPYALETRISFNISHTSGLVACAFLYGNAVGVDVERRDRTISADLGDLARRVCGPDEARALTNLETGGINRERFIRAWTRKEAVTKATGDGLRLDPRTVVVIAAGADGERDVEVVVANGQHWCCWTSATDDDCFLSVAWPARLRGAVSGG